MTAILPLLETPAGTTDAARLQMERWRGQIARWESEPDTQEGRRELMVRARQAETARDQAMADDGRFGMSSAMIQIAIVLASAAIITGLGVFTLAGLGLGVVGSLLAAVTFFGIF